MYGGPTKHQLSVCKILRISVFLPCFRWTTGRTATPTANGGSQRQGVAGYGAGGVGLPRHLLDEEDFWFGNFFLAVVFLGNTLPKFNIAPEK